MKNNWKLDVFKLVVPSASFKNNVAPESLNA